MTLPIIRVPKRPPTTGPSQRRGRRWDSFFEEPAALESDYHRMARRQEERSARFGGHRT